MHVFVADGDLLVIETEDDRYLGTVALEGEHFVIRDGFVGRPLRVPIADVIRVTAAADHEDLDHDQ